MTIFKWHLIFSLIEKIMQQSNFVALAIQAEFQNPTYYTTIKLQLGYLHLCMFVACPLNTFSFPTSVHQEPEMLQKPFSVSLPLEERFDLIDYCPSIWHCPDINIYFLVYIYMSVGAGLEAFHYQYRHKNTASMNKNIFNFSLIAGHKTTPTSSM